MINKILKKLIILLYIIKLNELNRNENLENNSHKHLSYSILISFLILWAQMTMNDFFVILFCRTFSLAQCLATVFCLLFRIEHLLQVKFLDFLFCFEILRTNSFFNLTIWKLCHVELGSAT